MPSLIATLRQHSPDAQPSLHAAVHAASFLLKMRAVDSPQLSAELILAKSCGLSRNSLLKQLLLHPDTPLSSYQMQLANALTARRLKGEPVAYILGEKEFYGKSFLVTRDTLIPRPETELLVDLALTYANKPDKLTGGVFADFGTGSGCIAVTLARELIRWRGLALDKSLAALSVAARNASRHMLLNLTCLLADFAFPPISPYALDLLVSNPPYVSEAEYQNLSPEIRNFEPKTALVPASGKAVPQHCHTRRQAALPSPAAHGLEDAERIIARAQQLIKPGGLLLMEMGSAQAEALLLRLDGKLWNSPKIVKDLAGLDRVLMADKNEWCYNKGKLQKVRTV